MTTSRVTFIAAICVICCAGAAGAADSDEAVTVVQQEPCCFENPRFSGTCQVTPGTDESCGDILAYLNNPNSAGKAYCGNTKVRGGWAQVPCEGSASTATESCGQDRE